MLKSKCYMKTKVSRKSLQKKYVFLLIIVVLATVAFGFLFYRHHTRPNDATQATPQQKVTDGTPQKNTAAATKPEPTVSQTTTKGSAAPSAYSTPTSADSIVLGVSQNNPNVVVTTKLYGYSDGACILSASNGDKSTTQSAPVMFQPEYSTCAGFSVPIEQLGNGTWTVKLSVTSGGKTLSKEMSYEVK